MGGCEVRLTGFPMIPYLLNTSASWEKPNEAGLEVTVLHEISSRMGFTSRHLTCPYPNWGFKNRITGQYNYLFRDMLDNVTDIIFGMSYGNASNIGDFDGSHVYLLEKCVWWVPSALPIAQWKNISAIFERNLWFAILFILLVNGFAWRVFGRKTEENSEYRDVVMCILKSFYTLLQGSVRAPSTWRLRMVFVVWLFCCLLLFAAHQSSLVSVLTTPIYDQQISSIEEIVQSKMAFGFYEGAHSVFEDTRNNTDEGIDVRNYYEKTIYDNYQNCPLSLQCMNRTAFKRDFAYFKNFRNIKYHIPRWYTFPNGRTMVHQLDSGSVGILVRFHMRKGFPLLDRINQLLMTLQSNGLVSKWDKEAVFKNIKVIETDNESLEIGHLQAAFLILILGLFVSLLTLIVEKIVYTIKLYMK